MKKLLAILLALGILFSLAACGSREIEEPDPTEPPVEDPTDPPVEEPVEAPDAGIYLGIWETAEGYMGIYEDGSFTMTDESAIIYASGTWELLDEGILLTFEDETVAFLIPDGEGNLYGGDDFGTLFPAFGEDTPDEIIFNAFVGGWYLFGDLNAECLVIYPDGTFEAVSAWQEDGMGQFIVCDGVTYGGDDGILYLTDYWGEDFGCAILGQEGLTLELAEGYAYFVEYEDAVFYRESDSMSLEGQPMEEDGNSFLVGDWIYSEDGVVLSFDAQGNFIWITPDGIDEGTYFFDGEIVTFFQDGSPVAQGYLDSDDDLHVDEESGYYYKGV